MSVGAVYVLVLILDLEDHFHTSSFLGHIALDYFPHSLSEIQWLMLVGIILVLAYSEANQVLLAKDCATIMNA